MFSTIEELRNLGEDNGGSIRVANGSENSFIPASLRRNTCMRKSTGFSE